MSNECINNKSVVSLDEFNTYSNNFSDTHEDIQMKVSMLESAQKVVETYLGYGLAPCHHKEKHIGTGQSVIYLDNLPVTNIWSVSVDGRPLDNYEHGMSSISLPFRLCHNSYVTIEYDTSWDEVPDLIKMTIMRIAALLLTEANGNIGITSKSFGDQSRNFLNFTNFQKYLDPLALYRIFKL